MEEWKEPTAIADFLTVELLVFSMSKSKPTITRVFRVIRQLAICPIYFMLLGFAVAGDDMGNTVAKPFVEGIDPDNNGLIAAFLMALAMG
jgi:hypothetical protein